MVSIADPTKARSESVIVTVMCRFSNSTVVPFTTATPSKCDIEYQTTAPFTSRIRETISRFTLT